MALCKHDIDTTSSVCLDCLPAVPRARYEQDPSRFGPWTEARFSSQCSGCAEEIEPGDDIRADGQRGWLGRCCGEDYAAVVPVCQVPDPKDILHGRLSAGSIDRGWGAYRGQEA